jgi:hypothetical protein
MSHRHAAVSSRDVIFTQSRNPDEKQNRAAHGNITRVDTCACGAVRRTHINQHHIEREAWQVAK